MIDPHRQAGFTLIELVIAVTLLAMVSVMLFGGLRFGARAWETGARTIERNIAIEGVQDLLRRTLNEAVPADPSGPFLEPMLAGEADGLRFVAPVPQHSASGGLARYALGRNGKGSLVLTWAPYRPDSRAEAPSSEPALLLERTEELVLSYFGAAEAGARPDWHDSWTSAEAMPLLIRIAVALPEKGQRWPELVIAPRLARPPQQ